jgi:hypothetical protein
MTSKAIAFMFSMSLVACATDSSTTVPTGGGTGGKADSAKLSAHAQAVRACAAAPNDDALHRCVSAANDASADTIDMLGATEDGSALHDFYELEKQAADMCGLFSETLVAAVRPPFVAQCRAARSRDLAAIIDGYVAFADGDLVPVVHRDAYFPECHATYDAAIRTARATAQQVEVTYALADCIDEEMRTKAAKIAPLIQRTGDVELLVQEHLDAAYLVTSGICDVVVAASGEAGGSLANVLTARCHADIIEQIGTLVFDTVPME